MTRKQSMGIITRKQEQIKMLLFRETIKKRGYLYLDKKCLTDIVRGNSTNEYFANFVEDLHLQIKRVKNYVLDGYWIAQND